MNQETWDELVEMHVMNGDPAHDLQVITRRIEGCIERGQIDVTEVHRWLYALATIRQDLLSQLKSPTPSARRLHGWRSRVHFLSRKG